MWKEKQMVQWLADHLLSFTNIIAVRCCKLFHEEVEIWGNEAIC